MARQRIPLVFGGGIDRETGIMAAPPGAMEEIQNLWLRDGRATVRRGMEEASAVAGATICMVHPLRSEGSGVVVTIDSARKVDAYRVSGLGTHPVHLGEIGTLHPLAHTPPRFLAAEIYGGLFLAHDEPHIARRLPTYHYDQEEGQWRPLEVRFGPEPEGEDDRPVHVAEFRGVTRHLAYLMGWGWGLEEEPRPELLRISRPGEPTNFSDDISFTVGHRGDPIILAVPVGQSLVVFKESETWRLDGYDYATFGMRPADPLFGLASSRLAVVVGDSCFFWSLEGPRVTGGGESADLALPLGLGGPQPVDLEAEGLLDSGFAVYHPMRQAVLFVFGEHAYVLHLRNPGSPRWGYMHFGHPLAAGGVIYGAGIPAGAEPGYVTDLEAAEIRPTEVDLAWERVDEAGDEQLEIWLRVGAGAWTLYRTLPSFPRRYTLDGLSSGTAYEVALRARRLGQYRPGFQGTPDQWDAPEAADAFLEFTTEIGEGALTAAWRRVSASEERILLTLDGDPTLGTRFFKSTDGEEGPWTQVGSDLAPGTMEYDYEVQPGEGETPLWFKAQQFSEHGAQESNVVRRWVGPDAPVDARQADLMGSRAYEYTVEWETGHDGGALTEVADDYDCPSDPPVLRETVAAGLTSHTQRVGTLQILQPYGEPIYHACTVALRHKTEAFSVEDFSEQVMVPVQVIAQDPDEWPPEQGPWPGDGYAECS